MGLFLGLGKSLVFVDSLAGFQGLYRGMETKLWHSTLISALMFLTYEKIQTGVSALVSKKTAVKVP